MNKHLAGGVLTSALFLLTGSASAAEPIDLLAATHLALERAPAYAAAEAGQKASEEQRGIGRAALLPTLAATGSMHHFKQRFAYSKPTFLSTSANYNKSSAGISLVQPLFDMKRWSGYQQGKIAADLGELELDLVFGNVVLAGASAYLQTVSAEAALAASRAQEASLRRLAEQSALAFEVGSLTVNETLDAKSRLDLVVATRMQAENDLAQAEANLASLLGSEPVLAVVPFANTFAPLALPSEEVGEWERRAAESSPPVRLAEARLALAEQQARGSAYGHLPTANFIAGVEYDKTTGGSFGMGTRTNNSHVGVQVDLPLFAGGAVSAKAQQDEYLRIKAGREAEESRRQARLNARAAFLAVRTSAAQVVALQAALHSAETAHEAAAAGHEAGLRTIGELLDSEDRLAATRRDLARAKAAHIEARIRLALVCGEFSDATLVAANGLLAVATPVR